MVSTIKAAVHIAALVVFCIVHNVVDAVDGADYRVIVAYLQFWEHHLNIAAQRLKSEVLFVRVLDVDFNFFHTGIAFVYLFIILVRCFRYRKRCKYKHTANIKQTFCEIFLQNAKNLTL